MVLMRENPAFRVKFTRLRPDSAAWTPWFVRKRRKNSCGISTAFIDKFFAFANHKRLLCAGAIRFVDTTTRGRKSNRISPPILRQRTHFLPRILGQIGSRVVQMLNLCHHR